MPYSARQVLGGRFRLDREVGTGGMGTVWQAADLDADTQVAVKILRDDRASDPRIRERFLREMRALQALDAPHVVRLLEVGGDDDGLAWFAMPWVDGVTLSDALRARTDPFPAADVRAMGIQLAVALQAVHDLGIIHRDLKPSNILRAGDGTLTLLDFGVAHLRGPALDAMDAPELTARGELPGTPLYLAPEMIAGKRFDHRADQYGLGVLLYVLVTRHKPFDVEGRIDTLRAHLLTAPIRPRDRHPGVPGDLEAVLLRLLRKEPTARYKDMAAVAKALSPTPRA